jgi:methionyl-tRNA formyltransferase
VAITGEHTGGTLLAELEQVGTQALAECLTDIASRLLRAEAQDEQQTTYAAKVEKAETAIDWCLGAIEIDRKVRALLPSPGCFTMLNDDRFKVWAAHAVHKTHNAAPGEIVNANNDGLSVACGEGVLVITEAQMPGGKPQSVAALLNGHQDRLKLGVRFTLTGNNAHV